MLLFLVRANNKLDLVEDKRIIIVKTLIYGLTSQAIYFLFQFNNFSKKHLFAHNTGIIQYVSLY